MTQDTRKDRRAKIVSLNVRYKSATVDEFIDNHSHDVSKGGLFIKTSSPFPPGTLLKFEIRIAGDKAVIAGVGRVVWKRETSQAGPEVPAGMGVKFIKIDDASRAVIDKLVESRGEGRNAYDEGTSDAEAQEGASAAAPSQSQVGGVPPAVAGPAPGVAPVVAPVVARAAVPVGLSSLPTRDLRPVGPVPAPHAVAPPQTAPFRPAPSASKIPAALGKSTMMGIGGIQDAIASAAAKSGAPNTSPAAGRPAADDLRTRATPSATRKSPGPPAVSSSSAAKSAGTASAASSVPSTSPMFPKTNSEADMPPKNEQTVMKQAAELLEEALLGAGGSMDEIGQNPLFDIARKDATPATTKDQPASAAKAPTLPTQLPTPQGLSPTGEPAVTAEPAPALVSAAADRAPVELDATARSATHDEPPLAEKDRPAPVRARPISGRPLAASFEEETPKNKWLLPVVGLAAAGVLGFFAYSQLYAPGSDTPPEPASPSSVVSVAAPPAASPPVSAAPPTSAAPETPSATAAAAADDASAAAEDASAAAPDAAAAASTGAVAKPPQQPTAPWRPPPPKPKPPPADTGEKPPAEAPTNAAPPTPAETAAPTAADTPAPAPKPAPKPKSTKKQDDDNPY
jgi:uncharacterized protein (TIGR02266 family)